MSSNRQKIECNILFGNNRTLLNIDVGWEGIPFNIVFNTIIAAGLLIAYAVIRWRVKKVGNKSKEQIGKLFLVDNWLPFIYGDKKTNDRITAKFKEIDKRHHLAYLPPILHEYEDQMPEKISVEEVIAEEDASIGFYRHPSSLSVHSSLKRGPKQDQQISNNDIPTVRSELSEKLPDDPYTQLTTEICSDTDEDREVRQLKSVLIHDYVSKEVEKSTKVEPKTPPKPEIKLLDYVKQVIKKNLMITDEKIMKNKGTDAIKYLLFQRYLIYFQTLMTCVCLLIILPINLYGNAVLSKHKFMRTTISNLGNESNLVWIHSLMACIMIVTGYYMTHHFHNVVNTHTRDVDQKTLIIENITKSGRKSSQLFNYFKKRFPKVMIKRITFVYDIRKLDKLDYRLLTAIEAKQYCHRYWLEFGYRCEVRPYCLGKFGGVCLCCGCCPKLDGTLYYAEEKAELKNLIKKEVKRLFWEPVGRVFVVFADESMAAQVYNEFYYRCSCCTRFLKSIGRIFVSNQTTDPLETYNWEVNYAPNPENLEWTDLSLDKGYSCLMSVIFHTILTLIFLFLSTPSIAVNILMSPFGSEDMPVLVGLRQFGQPYLLMAMTSILPSLISLVQNQIPYKTKSSLSHALMFKSYFFLILMVLILPALGLYTSAVMLDMLFSGENTSSKQQIRWNCLFPSGNSAFFMNYVLSSALVSNSLQILLVPEAAQYALYLLVLSRSVAEYESARLKIHFDFSFGSRYPILLLIFTVVTTYSISSPLIAPVGLFYLLTKHLVDRYNLYYVYSPSPITDKMHRTALYFVQIAFFFMSFQVVTTLSQYNQTFLWFGPAIPVGIVYIIQLPIIVYKFFTHI